MQRAAMLCRDVKRVVYFFLDGSLGETTRQDLKSHLSLCPDCERRMRVQQALRNFLMARFARLSAAAPPRLKTRLTRSIRAFRTEWSR
ncbi:MAG TPA: zf-HC2 domain-containing protein [Thermoanaerobaculia bacterium]